MLMVYVDGCTQCTTSLVNQNERRSCLHCMETLVSGKVCCRPSVCRLSVVCRR